MDPLACDLSYPETGYAVVVRGADEPVTGQRRIGERLRFYRQARGKTQAVVAGLAGVTEGLNLSQIERGLSTPTIALLHRFSKILGVRISELLGESAAEHSEAAIPAGNAVQRALMAYQGERETTDPHRS